MIYRTDDCQRCYGLNKLLFCGKCKAWFCFECLKNHSHESYLIMTKRMDDFFASDEFYDWANQVKKDLK